MTNRNNDNTGNAGSNDHLGNTMGNDADQRLDANLRALAPRLAVPADPTDGQAARWTSSDPTTSATPLAIHGGGGATQVAVLRRADRRHRWMAYASAAAVLAVAAGGFLIASLGTNKVQAATILKSLRNNTFSGIRATLTDIRMEGVSVTGQVQIRFDRELTAEEMFDPPADAKPPIPDSLYCSLDVKLDGTNGAPKLDVHSEAAFSPESDWVFVRTEGAIGNVGDNPLALFISGAAQKGVLLDLGKGNLQHEILDGFNPGFDVGVDAAENRGPNVQIIKDEKGGSVKVTAPVDLDIDLKAGPAKFRLPGGQVPVIIKGRDLPPEITNMIAARVPLGHLVDLCTEIGGPEKSLLVAVRPEELPVSVRAKIDAYFADELLSKLPADKRAAIETKITVDLSDDSINGFGPEKFAGILGPILSGKASPKQMRELLDVVTKDGGTSEVRDMGHGRTMLICRPSAGPGQQTITMNVSYVEGTGVEWMEFAGVGDLPTGAIRIETFSGPISPELMSKSRLDLPGVIHLDQSLLKLMGGMGGGAGMGAGGGVGPQGQ